MTEVIYERFEMPEAIKVDEETASKTYAKFIVEPFEKGFGHTLGNALRRMLLTSIEAPALISFMMEGISHEYMAVEGITEDITTIILNLKGALLRYLPLEGTPRAREPKLLSKVLEVTESDLGSERQKVITLGDLIDSDLFEIVNPNTPIFTVTQPLKKRIELKVAFGRGYVPSEEIEIENRVVNQIVMDAIFSPVRLVNYFVQNTRVGQATDFDRLILEVTTDGRVTPKEAVAFSAKILTRHLGVFDQMEDFSMSFHEPMSQSDNDLDELMAKLVLGINEIELSVRSTNCLNGAMIETIGELVVMPEPKLLQFRNFGKKSLNEIKAKLTEMGLYLGMDLTRFGITQDNIKDKITEFLQEQGKKVEA